MANKNDARMGSLSKKKQVRNQQRSTGVCKKGLKRAYIVYTKINSKKSNYNRKVIPVNKND